MNNDDQTPTKYIQSIMRCDVATANSVYQRVAYRLKQIMDGRDEKREKQLNEKANELRILSAKTHQERSAFLSEQDGYQLQKAQIERVLEMAEDYKTELSETLGIKPDRIAFIQGFICACNEIQKNPYPKIKIK